MTSMPVDVDHPRPPIDLAAGPETGDPTEVARWWAATHAAYIGAEPGPEVADRLNRYTTATLAEDLADAPATASYQPPASIVGVAAVDLPSPSPVEYRVRASVETDNGLVIYDLTLVEAAAGGWRIHEAATW